MLQYTHSHGSHCHRAIHTAHAEIRNDEGKLIARAEKSDQSGMYEFEIKGFEILQPGVTYD